MPNKIEKLNRQLENLLYQIQEEKEILSSPTTEKLK